MIKFSIKSVVEFISQNYFIYEFLFKLLRLVTIVPEYLRSCTISKLWLSVSVLGDVIGVLAT
jgi:hypothetical protein